MLQIPNHFLLKSSKPYSHFATAYLHDGVHAPTVLIDRQKELLNQLDRSIEHEQFYLVLNLKNNSIEHCNGTNRWLGYPDDKFTADDYTSLIHPSHALLQGLYAIGLFEALIENRVSPRFLEPICSSTIAIRHDDGQYIYCKRVASPFQVSDTGKMTSYLMVFSIIKPFYDDDFTTRFFSSPSDPNNIGQTMKQKIKSEFEKADYLSFQEFRVLKKYASEPTANSEMIAKSLLLEKATVDTYNKRILKKLEDIFYRRFSNARSAAAFLKRAGLI